MRSVIQRLFFGLFLFLGLGLGTFSSNPAHAAGEIAADFSLRDMNGKLVNLSDFKGQVVLISFFSRNRVMALAFSFAFGW